MKLASTQAAFVLLSVFILSACTPDGDITQSNHTSNSVVPKMSPEFANQLLFGSLLNQISDMSGLSAESTNSPETGFGCDYSWSDYIGDIDIGSVNQLYSCHFNYYGSDVDYMAYSGNINLEWQSIPNLDAIYSMTGDYFYEDSSPVHIGGYGYYSMNFQEMDITKTNHVDGTESEILNFTLELKTDNYGNGTFVFETLSSLYLDSDDDYESGQLQITHVGHETVVLTFYPERRIEVDAI